MVLFTEEQGNEKPMLAVNPQGVLAENITKDCIKEPEDSRNSTSKRNFMDVITLVGITSFTL